MFLSTEVGEETVAERIRRVAKFAPVSRDRATPGPELVLNWMVNLFPLPVKLDELYLQAKEDGYLFGKQGFKFLLYKLHDEGKVVRIRAWDGVYWLANKRYLNY